MNTAPKKLFDKRFGLLLGLQILIALFLGIFISAKLKSSAGGSSGDLEYLREVANKLQAVGVLGESARAYEKYLEGVSLAPPEKAKLAFSIGQLLEQEGKYEEALSWYYRVEILDSASPHVTASRQKIVSLLERLKKFGAAQYALKESTGLGGTEVKKGGPVVAKVGEEEIHLYEINEALDALPPYLKENFKSAEGKKNFAKKYVADTLLLKKAEKLGYQSDSKIREQLDKMQKQLMVQKVLEEEILKKIVVEESDVANFFQAHKEQYAHKANAQISLIKVKEKEKSQEVMKKLKEGKAFKDLAKEYSLDQESKDQGGQFREPILKNAPFMGHSQEITNTIFATPAGKWTEPLLSQGAYYIILVRSKEEEKPVAYENIKKQVEEDYRQHKQGTQYQQLIEETLKNQDLQLFLDNVQ